MHVHDQVPVRISHIPEADISQNPGVVNQNINPAEAFNSCLDDLLALVDVVIVGDSFSTTGFDLADDCIGHLSNVWHIILEANNGA